jgi:hypothetical protein
MTNQHRRAEPPAWRGLPDHERVGSLGAVIAARALCALIAVSLFAASPAVAQERRWLVVVATTRADDVARAQEVGEHAAAGLAASGEVVIASEQATARIESQLSQPFQAPPAELTRRLGQSAESALEDVAFAREQRALDMGLPLLAALDPHLAGLGRDPQAAQDLASLCLSMVRAHQQRGDAGAARQQMLVCMRLVPDLAPDPQSHARTIVTLAQELRTELSDGSGGVLAIHASPADPEHCAIRLNGRQVGESPVVRIAVPPGTYAVQMECDATRPGRRHSVTVSADAPTRIVLRGRLAQVLESRPALALVYPDTHAADEHLAEDLTALGEFVTATRVMAVVDDGRTTSLRAFALREGATAAELTGSAPVPEPIADETSRRAVQEVIAGRRIEVPDPAADDEARAVEQPSRPVASDVGVTVLGGALLAAGIGGLGVSWYFWGELEATGRAIPSATSPLELGQRQRAYDEAQLPVIVTGAASSVIATIGLPLLLPHEDGVPWWSWIVGAAGLGVGAFGVYEMTVDGVCYGNTVLGSPCARRQQTAILGALILEHALPLIAVPLTYVFRAVAGPGSSVTAAVQADDTSASLSVSGAF